MVAFHTARLSVLSPHIAAWNQPMYCRCALCLRKKLHRFFAQRLEQLINLHAVRNLKKKITNTQLFLIQKISITSRVVHHQVTRLQELTYGSTSFPLGDATGSTNWRLYATTGTITSPLVKTGHIWSHTVPTGPNYEARRFIFIFSLFFV